MNGVAVMFNAAHGFHDSFRRCILAAGCDAGGDSGTLSDFEGLQPPDSEGDRHRAYADD